MRILTVPIACFCAFWAYWGIPNLSGSLSRALSRLFIFIKTRRNLRHPLAVYLLIIALPVLAAAWCHPVAACALMIPLFPAFACLGETADIKEELDSGAYRSRQTDYDKKVRSVCKSLAPTFVCDALIPILLCSLGTPLYLGASLGWVWFALRCASSAEPVCVRAVAAAMRLADKLFRLLLLLCAGLAGRSPFYVRGSRAEECLIDILGIAGTDHDTHVPVSGDMVHGIFLCTMACAVLSGALCLLLYPVCR